MDADYKSERELEIREIPDAGDSEGAGRRERGGFLHKSSALGRSRYKKSPYGHTGRSKKS
jgi:hypothetical protein